jgi:hypothetical protein
MIGITAEKAPFLLRRLFCSAAERTPSDVACVTSIYELTPTGAISGTILFGAHNIKI